MPQPRSRQVRDGPPSEGRRLHSASTRVMSLLMILIVTTIDVYLAVYQGVELGQPEDQSVRRTWLPRRKGQPDR